MRSRNALVLTAFALLLAGSTPVLGQEPTFMTVSGGWTWPVGGPVEESYESGFTLAGSFRTAVAPNFMSGFEVGYTWLGLDSANLTAKNPGSTISGDGFGLLSITTENDYLIGSPGKTARPFVNLGLGYFRSFIGDVTASSGSTRTNYETGVYEGSFFGFHAGVGLLIHRDRFGLRLDANYHHLFAAGKDLEFFPIRAGIVFYPSRPSAG